MDSTNETYQFPIYDAFQSKRGVYWHFKIFPDYTVEQWHDTIERCAGGWRTGKTVFVDCTKECMQFIKNKYGITVDCKYADDIDEEQDDELDLTAGNSRGR